MVKRFNTTGICYPEEHYMVDITGRLDETARLVDRGEYFVVNRARQYGKTTMLHLLAGHLKERYFVLSISFEGMSDDVYRTEQLFVQRICGLLYNAFAGCGIMDIPEASCERCREISCAEDTKANLFTLSNLISRMCQEASKPVVLIIDEVDQASSQQVFLTFLGMLRDKYLKRKTYLTFQSVILAGVYDIKNLKLRVRPDSLHRYNSPWNIASDFTVDMSFSTSDIAGMLHAYDYDHGIGMDVLRMAEDIYNYTFGYPFLVSRLCRIMDEILPGKKDFPEKKDIWTQTGFQAAVKELLAEPNTLFDDLAKKMADYPELKQMLYAILFRGKYFAFNRYNLPVNIGLMLGFLKDAEGSVAVSNRIFETCLYNLFLSEDLTSSTIYDIAASDRNLFVKNGYLDMELVLERFVDSFTDIYADAEERFLEENGRRLFLLYLKPIINGTGNYYIEAHTRNMRRTDVIIDYHGRQYVCELKIWRGKEYHEKGEKQLAGYLEDYHLTTGYMVSFNFNKHKETGIRKIEIDGKMIIEAVV